MEFSVVIGHSQPSWILLFVILSQPHRQCNRRKTWCTNKWYFSLKPTLFQWIQDHWQSSNVYYRFTAVQHQLLKEFYLDHKRFEHKIGNNFSRWPQPWCRMIKMLAVLIWITHTLIADPVVASRPSVLIGRELNQWELARSCSAGGDTFAKPYQCHCNQLSLVKINDEGRDECDNNVFEVNYGQAIW